jgi:hypothetical protein
MSVVSTRKIISGTALLVVGVGITLVKGDIPPNLLALMESLYIAFVAGNGVEHYVNMKRLRK